VKTIGNLTKDAIIRAVASEGINVTQEIGTGVVFESATTQQQTVVYDSTNQKIVIGYRDQGNNNYGTAVVATVSGNSISYGTPTVFYSATTGELSGAFDSNSGKVVFSFEGGKSVVGTVSGTSISFGSAVTFDSSGADYTSTTFDSANNKIVVFYRGDPAGNRYGTAIVGTVSGTSISFGSAVAFNNANTPFLASSFDSNAGKVVAAYKDVGNSNYGTAIVGTVSGTSISFGSETVFNAGNCGDISTAFDSTNNKIVIAYTDDGNSNQGTAIVGTVSGTSISFGSEVVYNAASTSYNSASFDSTAGRVLISYSDAGNSDYGEAVVGTVSGTSISFGDMALFKNGSADHIASAYDSNQGRVVIAYRTPGNSNYGEAVVFKVGYSQATGGTIADGAPVIVNANGTVSGVTQTAVSAVTGTKAVFESAESNFTRIAYDPVNNKMLIIYCDAGDSGKGKCVVATISGTSITYGSVTTFHNANTNFADVIYDTNAGKFVIVYYDGDNSGYGTSVVATVSGNSVTFGSDVVFNSANCNYMSLIYSTAAQKVVVSYRTTSDQGKSQVGTVSGTSISWGSQYIFNSGTTGPAIHSSYDEASQNFIVAYKDEGNSSYGTARVGSISGTTITWGSETVFNAGSTDNISTVYDPTVQKIMIYYRDIANSSYGTAIVGTISGTAVTFGSEQVLISSNTTNTNIVHHPDASFNVIIWRDAGGGNVIKFATATVSGTTITFGTATQLNGEQGYYHDQAWDPVNKKIIVVYRASSNSDYGTAVAYTPAHNTTTITSENFIGIMNGGTLDGRTGEILSSCNVARNLTSLTPGQTYFVTPAGALSETAGSPSVTAGTAISSTELIVKG